MTFDVSSPLLALIQASNANPARLNALVDRRLARGMDARMRPDDHYPARLRRETGVPVVGISRARRHLFVEIESRRPLWRYVERSRNGCMLQIPATVPDTLKLALIGMTARQLVVTTWVIDDLPIDRIEDDGLWSTVWLRAAWLHF